MDPWLLYLKAFLITIAIEVPLFTLLSGVKPRLSAVRDCFFVNLFTHPLAVFSVWFLSAPFGLIECFVFLAEALLYWKVCRLSALKAISLAFLLNAITASLSFIL